MDIQNETKFSVGDILHPIELFNLSEATSLSLPIYISSHDIVDFDYVLSIDDIGVNFSVCTICKVSNDECNHCEKGIEITDLKTYDVSNNSYKISIESEFEAISPSNEIIINMQREVQQVHFSIIIKNETIYPNAEIYFLPKYSKSNPTQPNGTFTIQFDEDLNFEHGKATMSIDFYRDLCKITFGDKTLNCYEEAIKVPSTMRFKTIDENLYSIALSSTDTIINGETMFSYPRAVQTVSIKFTSELHLGEAIQIIPKISSDTMYQDFSSILVTNDELGIYSRIELQYNQSQSTQESDIFCEIVDPITGTAQDCSNGLDFSSSNDTIIDQYITLYLSSVDTYLSSANDKLLVTECGMFLTFFIAP